MLHRPRRVVCNNLVPDTPSSGDLQEGMRTKKIAGAEGFVLGSGSRQQVTNVLAKKTFDDTLRKIPERAHVALVHFIDARLAGRRESSLFTL